MGNSWSDPDVVEWKQTAQSTQNTYYRTLGDRVWDEYSRERDEHKFIGTKVGYAFYGPPTNSDGDVADVKGYTDEQQTEIAQFVDAIIDISPSYTVQCSVIFVCVKIYERQFTLPLIRVKTGESTARYVDAELRRYKSWEDYLSTNRLPMCMYCYPTNGFYSSSTSEYVYDEDDDAAVAYGTSPACDFSARTGRFFDTTASVTTLASAGVGIVGLFTPLAPVVILSAAASGITGGVYGAARSADRLVDRYKHDQSIGLTNRESFGCWLAIVGTVVGTSAAIGSSLTASVARAGNIGTSSGRFLVTALNFGSLGVNGVGMVFGVVVLIEKAEAKQLTTLDLLQFSASVFFFTQTAINVKTAGTIIKEVQTTSINEFQQSLTSKRAQRAFGRIAKDTAGERQMHGNAKVVKAINHIRNRNEFFQALGKFHGKAVSTGGPNGQQHQITLTPDGLININENVKLHPLKYTQMSVGNKQTVLHATRDLAANTIDTTQFLRQVRGVCRVERIGFEVQLAEMSRKAAEALGTDSLDKVRVGGKAIFKDLSVCQRDRLRRVFADAGRDYNADLAEAARNFAEANKCEDAGQFCAYMEYVSQFLNKNAKSKTAKRDFLAQLKNTGSEEYGRLMADYTSQKGRVCAAMQTAELQFGSEPTATYHYVKHDTFKQAAVSRVREFNRENHPANLTVTQDEYFAIAADLFGSDINVKNVRLSQDGEVTSMTYYDGQTGVFGVLVEPRQADGNVQLVATVYQAE